MIEEGVCPYCEQKCEPIKISNCEVECNLCGEGWFETDEDDDIEDIIDDLENELGFNK